MLQLIILSRKKFDKISAKYKDGGWGQKNMSTECYNTCHEYWRHKEWNTDEKVREKTEMKQMYIWFVKVFGEFWNASE